MADEEEAILICHRVADLPIPYAAGTIKICICTQGCLERVWVADSSPTHARPVCAQCAHELMKNDPEIKLGNPTPRQIAELARWLARRG